MKERLGHRRRPAWQGAGGGEGAWGRAVAPVCTRASPPPRSRDAEPSGRRSERDVTPGPLHPPPPTAWRRGRARDTQRGDAVSIDGAREGGAIEALRGPSARERASAQRCCLPEPFPVSEMRGRRREGPGSPHWASNPAPRALPPACHGRQSGALNTATRREKRSWNDLARGTDFCPFWGRARVLGEPATGGRGSDGGRGSSTPTGRESTLERNRREKQAEFFPPRETLGASSCGRRWGRHLLTRPFHVSWVVEPGREAVYGETRTRGRGEGRTEGWKRGVPPGGAARTSRPARNLPLEWPLSFSDFC